MDKHSGRIALRSSEFAMFNGGGRRDGIAVFIGYLGFAQTRHQVLKQLRKMSGTMLIAEVKVVELRRLLRSCQPVCD